VQIPVIGIPVYRGEGDEADYVMRRTYCDAITWEGGAPVLVPPLPETLLHRLYTGLDGLLLAGGGDVAGERYGASDSTHIKRVDTLRDGLEITLTQWALNDGLPLLAICRGIQVLNVAAGGTLVRDIPTQIPFCLEHRAEPALPRSHKQHSVCVTHGSLLSAVLFDDSPAEMGDEPTGVRCCGVNSYHHQAVERLAPGFVATAYAPDGIIEAIETNVYSGFVLGVQWHPECMVPGDAAMERLFSSFVGACRRRADTCQRREVQHETGRHLG